MADRGDATFRDIDKAMRLGAGTFTLSVTASEGFKWDKRTLYCCRPTAELQRTSSIFSCTCVQGCPRARTSWLTSWAWTPVTPSSLGGSRSTPRRRSSLCPSRWRRRFAFVRSTPLQVANLQPEPVFLAQHHAEGPIR